VSRFSIGQVILKRYRIVEFIAAGGMGSVFLAMKVLNVDIEDDPSAIKKFKRESNAYRILRHPNIVQYYGLEQTEDTLFMLQAYIDGDSLKAILSKPGNHPLPLPETLSIMKALCAALGFAHNAYEDAIIHCDIKPANVLIDRGGNIYLTDFGIARHAESSSTTMAGAGTPAYMAPEQIREEPVTPETDIYSLGILLYELTTGHKPFVGSEKNSRDSQKSVQEKIRYAHLHNTPTDPSQINPDIPQPLSHVILKALSKDPVNRYHSTQDLFLALCQACNTTIEQVPDRLSQNFMQRIFADRPLPAIDGGTVPPPVPKPKWMWIVFPVVAIFLLFIIKPWDAREQNSITTEPVVTVKSETATPSAVVLDKSTEVSATIAPIWGDKRVSENGQMIMVYIPASEFLMGSSIKDPYFGTEKFKDETPQHQVYLDSFWISETEITNSMFSSFVNETGYITTAEINGKGNVTSLDSEGFAEINGANWRHPYGPGSSIVGMDSYPVVQISWIDANEFCKWAGGRLPTEAEWEKAARGENGSIYPWGDASLTGKMANTADKTLNSSYWSDMSVEDGIKYLAPVKSFEEGASPYGVYDMAGNSWEWVLDWYDPDYYSSQTVWKNPQNSSYSEYKVLKGGSYVNGRKNVRSARRGYNEPDESLDIYGFRCVQP